MKILVTVKRVTDPDVKIKLLPDGSGVDTSNVEFKINPYDEYAIEEALRLRERYPDEVDEVIVLSIGNSAATKELRVAMAMGADRAIMVECDDSEFDATVVAKIIATVAEEEAPGIIMMGKLAVDGENTQVAQMVAQKLGWGQGPFALKLELNDGKLLLTCQADGGMNKLEVKLPCVILRSDMPEEEVRYASLPGIMKAKRKPLKTYTPEDLGVDIEPLTRIIGYEMPPQRDAGVILETVDELIDKLQNEVKIL